MSHGNVSGSGLTSLSLLTVLFVALGCSDASADSTDGHDHGDPVPVCEEISAVCHDVDALSERAGACHDVAHENEAEACETEKDACIAHCRELVDAGGHGGDDGHGGDGGRHH